MSTGGVEGPRPHQFTNNPVPLGKLIPGPSTMSPSKEPLGNAKNIYPEHVSLARAMEGTLGLFIDTSAASMTGMKGG